MMGFRSPAGIAWLAVAGILRCLPGLTWIAAFRVSAKTFDGASVLPIRLSSVFSSAFVPTETMPLGVRAFAENQPVTLILETIRALLYGQPVGNDIWIAIAWCVGIMLVAYVFAMRAYKSGCKVGGEFLSLFMTGLLPSTRSRLWLTWWIGKRNYTLNHQRGSFYN
jgi:ABC-2 type transport system permease protein